MIRHILADGREVASIEGLVVPNAGATAAVYRIVTEFAKNREISKLKDKGGSKECGSTAKHTYAP